MVCGSLSGRKCRNSGTDMDLADCKGIMLPRCKSIVNKKNECH